MDERTARGGANPDYDGPYIRFGARLSFEQVVHMGWHSKVILLASTILSIGAPIPLLATPISLGGVLYELQERRALAKQIQTAGRVKAVYGSIGSGTVVGVMEEEEAKNSCLCAPTRLLLLSPTGTQEDFGVRGVNLAVRCPVREQFLLWTEGDRIALWDPARADAQPDVLLENCASPAWLQDGSGFLATRTAEYKDLGPMGSEIVHFDLLSRRLRVVTTAEIDYKPVPSADGRFVLFQSASRTSGGIASFFLMPLDVSAPPTQLTNIGLETATDSRFIPVISTTFAWSDGGRTLHYQTAVEGSRQVWAIDIDPVTRRHDNARLVAEGDLVVTSSDKGIQVAVMHLENSRIAELRIGQNMTPERHVWEVQP